MFQDQLDTKGFFNLFFLLTSDNLQCNPEQMPEEKVTSQGTCWQVARCGRGVTLTNLKWWPAVRALSQGNRKNHGFANGGGCGCVLTVQKISFNRNQTYQYQSPDVTKICLSEDSHSTEK